MTVLESEQPWPDDLAPSRLYRVWTSVVRRGRGVVRRSRGVVATARSGARRLVRRVPGTMQATQAGAQATTSALQKLPDSTLRWLAASSIGLGAGLYLTGRQRLVVLAGVAPAVMMGVAIVLRPVKPVVPAKANP